MNTLYEPHWLVKEWVIGKGRFARVCLKNTHFYRGSNVETFVWAKIWRDCVRNFFIWPLEKILVFHWLMKLDLTRFAPTTRDNSEIRDTLTNLMGRMIVELRTRESTNQVEFKTGESTNRVVSSFKTYERKPNPEFTTVIWLYNLLNDNSR